MACYLISGKEVGMFVVPPDVTCGPWLGAAIRQKLGATVAGRLTLVERDGRLLWQDLPVGVSLPAGVDLQDAQASSTPVRAAERTVQANDPGDSWPTTLDAHSNSDSVSSGVEVAAGGEALGDAGITSTSQRNAKPQLLADVIGMSDAGLHALPQGAAMWRWFPKDVACWMRPGDQIAVLLGGDHGRAPSRDVHVDEVRCYLGLEI